MSSASTATVLSTSTATNSIESSSEVPTTLATSTKRRVQVGIGSFFVAASTSDEQTSFRERLFAAENTRIETERRVRTEKEIREWREREDEFLERQADERERLEQRAREDVASQRRSRTREAALRSSHNEQRGRGAEVCERLFVGGRLAALNAEWFNEARVEFVLNVTPDIRFYHEGESLAIPLRSDEGDNVDEVMTTVPIRYERVAVEDVASENLAEHFERGTQFIHDALEAGRERGTAVLVHCREGRSRSVAMCCAYLVRHAGWTLRDAYERVLERRPLARINNGFCKQLMHFEREVRQVDENSIDFFDKDLRVSRPRDEGELKDVEFDPTELIPKSKLKQPKKKRRARRPRFSSRHVRTVSAPPVVSSKVEPPAAPTPVPALVVTTTVAPPVAVVAQPPPKRKLARSDTEPPAPPPAKRRTLIDFFTRPTK